MRGLGLALVSLGLSLSLGFSATYYVSPTGSNTDPCTQAQPCDFQTALDNAATDGQDSTIIVAPGKYNLSTLIYTTDDGDGKLTIQAQDPNNKPILNGANNRHIMEIINDNTSGGNGDSGSDIIIKDLIFLNGKSTSNTRSGGLTIKASYANVTIEECIFDKNYVNIDTNLPSGLGGGLYIGTTGNITLLNNKFTSNYVYGQGDVLMGGGVYINSSSGSGNITLIGNQFDYNYVYGTYGNLSSHGGGAYILGGAGKIIMKKNAFKSNFAGTWNNSLLFSGGGGVTIQGSNIYLDQNEFYNNISYEGGGALIYTYAGTLTMTNNIFHLNSTYTDGVGGGLSLKTAYGYLELLNNTFFSNSAGKYGGGVYMSASRSQAVFSLYNNIIWGNSAYADEINRGDDIYILSTSSEVIVYYNLLGANSNFVTASSEDFVIIDATNYTYSNNITANPMFVDPINGDFHLQWGSPAIDAGISNISNLPSTDFDGDPRIINGFIDIGADEYSGNYPPQINSFTASPSSGAAPLTVNFTCDAVDPDGSVAEYRWDFEGDGQINTTTTSNTATFTYNSGGTYTARCTAIDNLGATAEATVSITVSSVTSGGGTGGGASSSEEGGCSSTSSDSPYLALLGVLFLRLIYRLFRGRTETF